MKISDRQLDRLRLGELEPEQAAALTESLREAGELGRLDDLIASSEAYASTYPPEIQVQQIREAARRAARQPTPEQKMSLSKLALVTAIVVAIPAALLLRARTDETRTEPHVAQPAAARLATLATLGELFERAERLEAAGDGEQAVPIYREMVAMDATPHPDAWLQAQVRLGLHAEAVDQEEAAREAYARTVAQYDVLARDRALTLGADAAAEAQYMLANQAASEVVAANLTGDDAELKEVLRNKAEAGGRAERELEKVLAYDRPKWSVAAQYRSGTLFESFARDIRSSVVPDRLSAEERESYRRTLDASAKAVEAQAIEAYEQAVELASTNKITTTESLQARLALKQLRREHLRVAAEPEPSPANDAEETNTLYSSALKAMMAGRFRDAIRLSERAIENGCGNKCLRVLGMAHHKLGNETKACEALGAAGSSLPEGLQCP